MSVLNKKVEFWIKLLDIFSVSDFFCDKDLEGQNNVVPVFVDERKA